MSRRNVQFCNRCQVRRYVQALSALVPSATAVLPRARDVTRGTTPPNQALNAVKDARQASSLSRLVLNLELSASRVLKDLSVPLDRLLASDVILASFRT